MGHRASVAYWDGDTVEAKYSHWGASGAKLLDLIHEKTPHADGSVDRDAYWEGDDLEAWAHDAIDFVFHEAAYVVDTESWTVRAFVPIRLPQDEEDGTAQSDLGALVEVEDRAEYDKAFCSEYDWAGDDREMTEEAFVARLHEEYGDRIPAFSRYAPDE